MGKGKGAAVRCRAGSWAPHGGLGGGLHAPQRGCRAGCVEGSGVEMPVSGWVWERWGLRHCSSGTRATPAAPQACPERRLLLLLPAATAYLPLLTCYCHCHCCWLSGWRRTRPSANWTSCSSTRWGGGFAVGAVVAMGAVGGQVAFAIPSQTQGRGGHAGWAGVSAAPEVCDVRGRA